MSYRPTLLLNMLACAVVLCAPVCAYASQPYAEAGGMLTGTVKALEGTADASATDEQDQNTLSVNQPVNPWEKIDTGAQSRLLIDWNTGLVASLGEFSSIVWSPYGDESSKTPEVYIIGGILRFADKPHGAGAGSDYVVTTPTVFIRPADPSGPTDFLVEVHDPSTTIVTVVSGRVRVSYTSENKLEETTVASCQMASIIFGQKRLDIRTASGQTLESLIHATTIPGTLLADLTACPTVAAEEPIPAPESEVHYVDRSYPAPYSIEETETYVYSSYAWPDYYYSDWEWLDDFPYERVTVAPYPRAGVACIVVIAGIGELVLPVDAIGGWYLHPAICRNYAYHWLLDSLIRHRRAGLHDLRQRQRHLTSLLNLSRATAARDTLLQAQRELDQVRIRADWATESIRRLQRRVGSLEGEQRRLGYRVPQGVDLYNIINTSFNSPTNTTLVQSLDSRLRNERAAQDRLSVMAADELGKLRRSVGQERNPLKRLELRNRLVGIEKNLAQGKLLVPPDQKSVKTLFTQMASKSGASEKRSFADQVVREIAKASPKPVVDPLSASRLDALQKKISSQPNQRQANLLQRRLGELKQSVEAVRKAEFQKQTTNLPIGTGRIDPKRIDQPRLSNQITGTQRPPQVAAPGHAAPSTHQGLGRQRLINRDQLPKQTQNARGTVSPSVGGLRNLNDQWRTELEKSNERQGQNPVSRGLAESQNRQAEMLRQRQEQQRQAQAQARLAEERKLNSELARQRLEEQKRTADAQRQAEINRRMAEQQKSEVELRRRQQEDQRRRLEQQRQVEISRQVQQQHQRGAELQRRQQEGQRQRLEQQKQAEMRRRSSQQYRQDIQAAQRRQQVQTPSLQQRRQADAQSRLVREFGRRAEAGTPRIQAPQVQVRSQPHTPLRGRDSQGWSERSKRR